MYFCAARDAFSQAEGCERNIARARQRVERLQGRIDDLTSAPDGDEEEACHRHYDKLEPLCIQMEDEEYHLGEAYAPMLQNLATVHILSAASAEAHINIQAQGSLRGREWDAFERLAVDTKWLFLPKLLGIPGFDPGKQPWQGFDSLLHFRNKLAHYRTRKEPFAGPGIPEFVVELGLTLESGKRSVEAVGGMIDKLSQQLGQDPPYWLATERANFFEVIFEK